MNSIFFYILIRAWRAFDNFDKCVDSVFGQNYKNYQILFVDDASPLKSSQKKHIIQKLKGHTVVFNKNRKYSIRNAYEMIHKHAKNNNSIVFNLDGDDWLPHSKCLETVASCYKENKYCQLTYGGCFVWDGKDIKVSGDTSLALTNIDYPKEIIRSASYRKYFFLSLHPRTWRVSLYKKIKRRDFLRPDGSWLRFPEDQAIFYPLLEMSGGNYKVIKKPIYVYNTSNKLGDSKINYLELLKDELIVRRKKTYEKIG